MSSPGVTIGGGISKGAWSGYQAAGARGGRVPGVAERLRPPA